nr:hypothetical protein [Tanacetum cinerariifolium]
MVRKRTASDMELQTAHHHRLLRRPNPPLRINQQQQNQNQNQNDMNMNNNTCSTGIGGSNYSTMTLPSCSTYTTNVMSLSCTTNSTSSNHHIYNIMDPNNKNNPPPPPPPLCNFSGLPLFPPDRNNISYQLLQNNNNNSQPELDDNMTTATAWIDSIIKDLIHTSTDVSIPHLIHNVREIIHPCNPNLATLLEYRLRSLTDPLPTNPPTLVVDQHHVTTAAAADNNIPSALSAVVMHQQQPAISRLEGMTILAFSFLFFLKKII